MSRSFVDTNILIYLVSHESDQDAATKSAKAREFIGRTEGFLISVQVLNEFTAACLAKQLVDAGSVQGHVKRFFRFFDVAEVSLNEIELAFQVRERYGYRWYDCLIIATALTNGCAKLYSEDMQDGQTVSGRGVGKLVIVNPLK